MRQGRCADGADDGVPYGSIGEMMRKVTESIKRGTRKDKTDLSINPRQWKEHGQRQRRCD